MNTILVEKLGNLDEVLAFREECRRGGQSVVWSNGCFDLWHLGHVRSLQAAAQLGDVLVVGVNSDESVRSLKGSARPVVPQQERALVVAALGCVDRVLIFQDLTPERVLSLLKPDVHCKGADYAPPSGKPIPERALVEGYGGRVEFLPLLEGLSSTDLVGRVRALPSPPGGPARPAVFLDRDGTLIEDQGYPRDPSLVRLLPGVADSLRALAEVGFLLILVSNQSGLGRGLIRPAEAEVVHARLLGCLGEQGIQLHASYYCPHAPADGCPCRKPSPGLLLQARADWNIDLPRSFLVGDKLSDCEAGRRGGCETVLLSSAAVEPTQVDFSAAELAGCSSFHSPACRSAT